MKRKVRQLAVIAADAQHRGLRMRLAQTFKGIAQRAAADVESHEQIAAESLQQRRNLAGIPDPEFHHHPGSQGCGDG